MSFTLGERSGLRKKVFMKRKFCFWFGKIFNRNSDMIDPFPLKPQKVLKSTSISRKLNRNLPKFTFTLL